MRLGEDVRTDDRMGLDQFKLKLADRPRPGQYLDGYRDLSHVVQFATLSDQFAECRVEPHATSDLLAQPTHRELVARGIRVAGLGHLGECRDCAVQCRLGVGNGTHVSNGVLHLVDHCLETLEFATGKCVRVARVRSQHGA